MKKLLFFTLFLPFAFSCKKNVSGCWECRTYGYGRNVEAWRPVGCMSRDDLIKQQIRDSAGNLVDVDKYCRLK